ncbi:TetR/AcrR family transcriptional regulator [Eubacteriaceae bacterium ES2]|nr:TetR/AcrR family transcriptional regulator [Eubacteriaceae bacterium ES2]
MRKKTKGELTKERIFQCAKELFYKQGYNATTIVQIAKAANSTLGSMTYHFATKDLFIDQIFSDYLENINESLKEKLIGHRPINAFENHFYLTMVWYHYLLSDPQVRNFYYEISKVESLYRPMHTSIEAIYRQFVEDYKLRIRPLEFDALLIADFGARRDLTRNYCEGKIKMPVEDFSILLISNTARCFGIPQKVIYKVSYEALLFFREHDFSGIKLLV